MYTLGDKSIIVNYLREARPSWTARSRSMEIQPEWPVHAFSRPRCILNAGILFILNSRLALGAPDGTAAQ